MHADELEIDEPLVRRLLARQFPEWADLPLRRIEPSGTVSAVFRLGEALSVRLARRDGPTAPGSVELQWLPRLAPLLPVEVPVPVAQGRPGCRYPWYWEVHTWVEGETVPPPQVDAIRAAQDLAALVGKRSIRPGRPPDAASPWRTGLAGSATGWRDSTPTWRSWRRGSARWPRRRGPGRPADR